MIGRIKKIYADSKLFPKMMSVFLASFLVICIFVLIGLQVVFYVYDRQLYVKSQQELDFFIQEINRDLREIEKVNTETATDEQIQAQIGKMLQYESGTYEYNYERQTLGNMIQNKIILTDAIKNAIYTYGNRDLLTVGTSTVKPDRQKYRSLLKEYQKNLGIYVTCSPTDEYPYMLCGRDIREKKGATLNYLGSLTFTVDVSEVLKKKVAALKSEHSDLFVYSGADNIYREGTNTEDIYSKITGDRGYRIITYNGVKSFLCYEKSQTTGWVYVNVFPYSEILGSIMLVRTLLLGVFVVLLVLIVLASWKIAKNITEPLEYLSDTMKVVETGEFETARTMLPELNRKDEVGILASEFDTMLKKIDDLIYENYEKQILIRDTKYKMLQAQINPHFLYNTLNAINWMIKLDKRDEASQMVLELGKLLHASLARDPVTTIKEELDMVKSYIAIQKFRYKNRAEFIIEETGQLEKYQMPRMILQPLVENAINYGVEYMLTTCRIEVYAQELEQGICLSVKNEGPGMEEDRLKEVREGTAKPQGHGIGLKNIKERMQMYFQTSKITINSKLGEGTEVILEFPKEEHISQG